MYFFLRLDLATLPNLVLSSLVQASLLPQLPEYRCVSLQLVHIKFLKGKNVTVSKPKPPWLMTALHFCASVCSVLVTLAFSSPQNNTPVTKNGAFSLPKPLRNTVWCVVTVFLVHQVYLNSVYYKKLWVFFRNKMITLEAMLHKLDEENIGKSTHW